MSSIIPEKIGIITSIEEEKSDKVIEHLVEKNIGLGTLFIRAAPIMETLTGIMIAGFIFYSGKLINSGELELNNFFSFLAAMMLAYQPIRSLATLNMTIYQGAAASKRIFTVIDQPIQVKEENDLPDLKTNKCNILFKNVNFKYLTKNEHAIKKIDMNIYKSLTINSGYLKNIFNEKYSV